MTQSHTLERSPYSKWPAPTYSEGKLPDRSGRGRLRCPSISWFAARFGSAAGSRGGSNPQRGPCWADGWGSWGLWCEPRCNSVWLLCTVDNAGTGPADRFDAEQAPRSKEEKWWKRKRKLGEQFNDSQLVTVPNLAFRGKGGATLAMLQSWHKTGNQDDMCDVSCPTQEIIHHVSSWLSTQDVDLEIFARPASRGFFSLIDQSLTRRDWNALFKLSLKRMHV